MRAILNQTKKSRFFLAKLLIHDIPIRFFQSGSNSANEVNRLRRIDTKAETLSSKPLFRSATLSANPFSASCIPGRRCAARANARAPRSRPAGSSSPRWRPYPWSLRSRRLNYCVSRAYAGGYKYLFLCRPRSSLIQLCIYSRKPDSLRRDGFAGCRRPSVRIRYDADAHENSPRPAEPDYLKDDESVLRHEPARLMTTYRCLKLLVRSRRQVQRRLEANLLRLELPVRQARR